jgi:hypothetical protein
MTYRGSRQPQTALDCSPRPIHDLIGGLSLEEPNVRQEDTDE